jgi:hypothetical protein
MKPPRTSPVRLSITTAVTSIYRTITVQGPDFIQVDLTPQAYALGLALALPERVKWVGARPTGVGRGITTYRIPIEGRDEWLVAAVARSA